VLALHGPIGSGVASLVLSLLELCDPFTQWMISHPAQATGVEPRAASGPKVERMSEEFWGTAAPLLAEERIEEGTIVGGPCVRAGGEQDLIEESIAFVTS
jgi:hypothetical protein